MASTPEATNTRERKERGNFIRCPHSKGRKQQSANQVPLRQLAQSLQLEELYSKCWQGNWEVEAAIFLAGRREPTGDLRCRTGQNGKTDAAGRFRTGNFRTIRRRRVTAAGGEDPRDDQAAGHPTAGRFSQIRESLR